MSSTAICQPFDDGVDLGDGSGSPITLDDGLKVIAIGVRSFLCFGLPFGLHQPARTNLWRGSDGEVRVECVRDGCVAGGLFR